MDVHPRAGQQAGLEDLADIPKLLRAYYANTALLPVQFGTSGHRGCALAQSFNEFHILAITQAIVDFRTQAGITGPVYLGMDTHALSQPAYITVLQVLLANGVKVRVQDQGGYTPTPAVSRAVIVHNQSQAHASNRADGIVITPSHNPPHHGGIKYNPPHGGPAQAEVTGFLQEQANHYLQQLKTQQTVISQVPEQELATHPCLEKFDFLACYLEDLSQVVDMQAIADAGFAIGIHPLGGACVAYWQQIIHQFDLNGTLVDATVNPTFDFMTLDYDGVIRMDCSSPWAMAKLLAKKDQFDLCLGNDADADRFGIVTPQGLLNSNQMLCIATDYLINNRAWGKQRAIGKTMVSTALLDRICQGQGIDVQVLPVGFKWFVQGLSESVLGFVGEESAGASLLCQDGRLWTTDKDGIVIGLLALEIMAKTKDTLDAYYQKLTERFGTPYYQRLDGAISKALLQKLQGIQVKDVQATTLAGDPITGVHTHAPANQQPFGGIKVESARAWFAIRPSGTEPIYKLYTESFVSEAHLKQVQQEAKAFLADLVA